MAQGDIQPPAEQTKGGGIFDEWKNASPKEKLLIVGGIAAVVAIMVYLHSKSTSSTNTINRGTATTPGTTPINTGVGTTTTPTQPTGTTSPTKPPSGQPLPQKPYLPVRPIKQQPTQTAKTYARSATVRSNTHAAVVPFQSTQAYRNAIASMQAKNLAQMRANEQIYRSGVAQGTYGYYSQLPPTLRGPR